MAWEDESDAATDYQSAVRSVRRIWHGLGWWNHVGHTSSSRAIKREVEGNRGVPDERDVDLVPFMCT